MTTGVGSIPYGGISFLVHNASGLVFDFGIEVGGIVTIKYQIDGTGPGAIGLAFTEARDYFGEWSDSSNGAFKGPDGAVYSNFSGPGEVTFTMPDDKLRGGFRYLTLFLITPNQTAQAYVTDISLEIGFQPTWSNLRAYQGYFDCSDAMLNKIWYSGAYTLQTNAVPPNTGRRASPMVTSGWANDGYLGPGDTIIVDGAKRDRAVWPGDMGVAVPSTFVSVGDLDSVRNALQVMYDYQNPDGSFPEAGPPLLQQGSDTYHMWTMVGTYNYMLYKNDTAFLAKNWAKYRRAMDYVLAKVQPTGLVNVTGTRDWARWQTGYNMTEAQMILYHTLQTGADLALWAANDTALSAAWTGRATSLQTATLLYCLDRATGTFRDNATSTPLHPQDANSMALAFGLVDPATALGQSISRSLTHNWTPLGAEPPELPGNISPFISSLELRAHLAAGQTARALDLIRRSWGWYLTHPNGTGSTVIEGYRTDGTWGYRSERGYGHDASYVSHAHGWSSGPTAALTEGVLGLGVTGRLGETWAFAPQFGDLGYARGGFVTGLGRFEAGWEKKKGDGRSGYEAVIRAPVGTRGKLLLPVLEKGVKPAVVVDGERVCGKWFRKGVADDVVDLVLVEVAGGNHTVIVTAPTAEKV
jgi:hypothetical protein